MTIKINLLVIVFEKPPIFAANNDFVDDDDDFDFDDLGNDCLFIIFIITIIIQHVIAVRSVPLG
jgi:hypothetical protein